MKDKQTQIVFFDFDGTLTRVESFRHFLKHTIPPVQYFLNYLFILPDFILFKLKRIDRRSLKQAITRRFYSNMSLEALNKMAESYCTRYLPDIIDSVAYNKLKWHQENGHKVVIVTAAFEEWIRPWCIKQKVDLIGTQLEIKNGYLTGNLHGPDNAGADKALSITTRFNLSDYSDSWAYGDTESDFPMFMLVNHAFFKNFDKEIRK